RDGPEVVKADGYRGEIHAAQHADHTVSRRVLYDVERDVAEVPFIRDAVSAPEAGLAVSEYVPCESDPRSEGTAVLGPESANGTLIGKRSLTVGVLLVDGRARSEEEVGIRGGVRVVFYTKIVAPHTEIQRQFWPSPPRIAGIQRKFVIQVAAAEV